MFWGWLLGYAEAGVLAWLGLLPLLWLARGPQPVRWCFVWGTVSWLVTVHWIQFVVHQFGGISTVLSLGVLVFMTCLLGFYSALFGWLVAKLRGWDVLLAAPLWAALEWSRGFFPVPFPWTLAGSAWVGLPGALELSAWIGVPGLGWLLVWVASGAMLALEQRTLKPLALTWGTSAMLLLLATFSAHRLPPEPQASNTVSLAVVQPNLPIQSGQSSEAFLVGYQRLLALTHQACRPGTLVVWPESASFPLNYADSSRLQEDVARVTSAGCDLLINAATFTADRAYNSVLLVGNEGVEATVHKRRLVPFGEYVPFAKYLPFVKIMARGAGGFSAAEGATPLSWMQHKVGYAICYEVSFSRDLAELAEAGADFFVGLSNDAWYGPDSWAQHQLLRAARFRAAENRRWLVRAALTGISAAIDPFGRVQNVMAAETEGTFHLEFAPGGVTTLYSRLPWLVPYGSVLLAMFAIFRAFRRTNAW